MGPYLCGDYKIVCLKSWENETLKYSLTQLILYMSCTYIICHTYIHYIGTCLSIEIDGVSELRK